MSRLHFYEAFPEEITFRGYVYRNLNTRFPRWLALVLQVVMFVLAPIAVTAFMVAIGIGTWDLITVEYIINLVAFGTVLQPVPHRIQQSVDEHRLSPGLAGDGPVRCGTLPICIHRDRIPFGLGQLYGNDRFGHYWDHPIDRLVVAEQEPNRLERDRAGSPAGFESCNQEARPPNLYENR